MYKLFLLATVVICSATVSGQTAEEFFRRGQKLKLEKKYTEALAEYKKATDKKANFPQAWFEMAWCYNEQKMFTDALAALGKTLPEWKEMPKLHFETGYAQMKLGRYTEALASFNECIRLKPDYANAHKHIGQIYYEETKDYTLAMPAYKNFVQYTKEPVKDAGIFYRIGYCETSAKNYTAANTWQYKALAIKSNYPEAWTEIGFNFYKLKMDDSALAAYRKAIALKATHASAYIGLGDVYKDNKKQTQQALEYYQQALQHNPSSKKALYCTGWCLNDLKRYADAITPLQKAIDLDNQYIVAWTEIGYSYYAQAQYNTAIEKLKKALNINANAENARYYLGLCYIKMGQKTNATEVYNGFPDKNSANAKNLLASINKMN
jgi:tetratricopeptide (TPR) repeat protein